MIVVAYASGRNGMTTWCLEVIKALHHSKKEYLLFCDENVKSTIDFNEDKVVVIPMVDSPTPTLFHKIKNQLWGRLFKRNVAISQSIHGYCMAHNIVPSIILWNDCSYYNKNLQWRQGVVAWAFPPHFWGYMKKLPLILNGIPLKNKIFAVLDSIGYYISDQYAYKNANLILAIHQKLCNELKIKFSHSEYLYPPIGLKATNINSQLGKIHLLIAALNLEESRKGIEWMLINLKKFSLHNRVKICLVGNCSTHFRNAYSEQEYIEFLGLLPRAQLQSIMSKMDAFLFASNLDDWGFVQTEALSNGLIVISPVITPFDEIVTMPELSFKPHDSDDFLRAIHVLINADIKELKSKSIYKAKNTFGYDIFVEKLIHLVDKLD
jgi:glycosyltransferase involved in cell wall biosynthesis